MPVNYSPRFQEEQTRTEIRQPLARDCMIRNLITLQESLDIYEAIRILLEHRISGAPVLNDRGEPVGILSEKDCMDVISHNAYHEARPSLQVRDYMSTSIHYVEGSWLLFDVIREFQKSNFRRLPVFDEGKLVGQISRRDCIAQLYQMHKRGEM